MAAKKKPTPKAEKPTPEPTPAEGQAAGVQGLALALHRCAHGIQAVGELASALLSRPTTADGRSCLERLVVAAEKQADARKDEAAAVARIAATHEADGKREDAEDARRAECHVHELAYLSARALRACRTAIEEDRRAAAQSAAVDSEVDRLRRELAATGPHFDQILAERRTLRETVARLRPQPGTRDRALVTETAAVLKRLADEDGTDSAKGQALQEGARILSLLLGPEPPAASPARQVAEAVAREAGLEVLDPPQA